MGACTHHVKKAGTACKTCVPTASKYSRCAEIKFKARLDEWFNQGKLPYDVTRWNRQNPEADPQQCSRYRPDFTYEIEAEQRVVIVEHDEGAHTSYELPCELKRQLELGLGFGGRPTHFIRFNPTPGFQHEPLIARREALLLSRLQAALAPAPSDDSLFNFFLTVEYLYYPPIGGSSGALQTFRFRTYAAYVQWVNAIDDGVTPPVLSEDPPAPAPGNDASPHDDARDCSSPIDTDDAPWGEDATPSAPSRAESVSVEPPPAAAPPPASATTSARTAKLLALALERAQLEARQSAERAQLEARMALERAQLNARMLALLTDEF